MNLTKFSIDRPIGICMAVAFFVVLGLFSFYRIGVELLPATDDGTIVTGREGGAPSGR